ncbi:MAG: aspartate 1-decarboxylase [candidate division CPR2 bacterium GW2011_GWC1_39_9]|uniref:Aspartate 1-decarboxylase n=1 Tax=candidate division CPR2 bacterium GW2011_GWC2_39_10 TaxID=1618345 RepID=A0A0G0PXR8_UNCC2|nr:MAG: aspartate 1-decarboxylase [candidate division CPR2 bacterium GW2011_GWC2_39_10]KKR35035.1 MAG: aspartate 1-decarboxylase [candidate division CPR2 bacterium GW2011_GWC1_39_9]
MQRQVLKSKIHRAVVRDKNSEYEGSITIGKELMDAADLWSYEKVLVADLNNGNRFETYVIEGISKEIIVNGAAAHLVEIGDKLTIMAFAVTDEPIKPKIYKF